MIPHLNLQKKGVGEPRETGNAPASTRRKRGKKRDVDLRKKGEDHFAALVSVRKHQKEKAACGQRKQWKGEGCRTEESAEQDREHPSRLSKLVRAKRLIKKTWFSSRTVEGKEVRETQLKGSA